MKTYPQDKPKLQIYEKPWTENICVWPSYLEPIHLGRFQVASGSCLGQWMEVVGIFNMRIIILTMLSKQRRSGYRDFSVTMFRAQARWEVGMLDEPRFIYSLRTEGRLGCFQILANMNKTGKNICVHSTVFKINHMSCITAVIYIFRTTYVWDYPKPDFGRPQ